MADLDEEFNPADVPEDDRSFDLLPRARYLMQIIESEIAETPKDADVKTGKRLVLTIEVIDGPLTNRRMWDSLNIRNSNPDAQRIAQRALADLCLAVGIPSLKNSDDLHFKPFHGDVGTRKDKRTGEDKQTIRYKPRGGQPPASKAAPAAAGKPAVPAQQQKPTSGRPWANQSGRQPTKTKLDDEIPF